MYRLLGLDALLPRSRYRASHDALFHVVMARVANPDSKRGSVRRLEEDFGVSLPLEKVLYDQVWFLRSKSYPQWWRAASCGQRRPCMCELVYRDGEIPFPCVSAHRGTRCGGQTISAKAGRTVEILALEPSGSLVGLPSLTSLAS